jgi:hypothetical protein
MIVSVFSLANTSAGGYNYGTRMKYNNNEEIHTCIDSEFEACTGQAIDALLKLPDNDFSPDSIALQINVIIANRKECLFDNQKLVNGCYLNILTNYVNVIKNVSLYNSNYRSSYRNYVHAELRLCKKTINKNCRTSSFVIDTMRSCVNDAILSFHKQVYPHIKGGQSAKTDVSNALISLQQSTIESKDGLVTGMEFVSNLDLLMDRLTFCSEQINHIEAIGI